MADLREVRCSTDGEPGGNGRGFAGHLLSTEDLRECAAALDFGPIAPSRPRQIKAPKGHMVYFVGGDGGPVKIGWTQQPIKERLKCIQSGSPVRLHVLALQPAPRSKELLYHRQFAAFRLHGEWFERSPEIVALIELLRRDQ